MQTITTAARGLLADESGAVAIEYAILAACIAMAVLVSVGAVGEAVADLFANPELADALG